MMSEVADRFTESIAVNACKTLGHDSKRVIFDPYDWVESGDGVVPRKPLWHQGYDDGGPYVAQEIALNIEQVGVILLRYLVRIPVKMELGIRTSSIHH
jgi:hypothetical protein